MGWQPEIYKLKKLSLLFFLHVKQVTQWITQVNNNLLKKYFYFSFIKIKYVSFRTNTRLSKNY